MRIIFIAIVIFAFFPVTAALAALPPLIDMEDFFRNPERAAFSISPDGTRLAFAKSWNEE